MPALARSETVTMPKGISIPELTTSPERTDAATHFAATPIAAFGIILFMGGTAYYILQQLIIASQGAHSVLRDALGADWKGKGSVLIHFFAIPMAYVATWVALALAN